MYYRRLEEGVQRGHRRQMLDHLRVGTAGGFVEINPEQSWRGEGA